MLSYYHLQNIKMEVWNHVSQHALLWDKMSQSNGKEDKVKKNIMIINADREAAQIANS